MKKLRNDQKGFAAVELIIVLVTVAVIGAVGYLVYKNHDKSNTATTTTPTSATPTDPYDGWKTYALKYEKASFKYPSSWSIKDSSFADSKTTGGGVDVIKLTGNNGFEMSVTDGGPNDYGFPDGGLTSVHTDAVTFLGQQAYMNLAEAGASNTGVVDSINVTTSKTSLTDFPTDKNVVAPSYQAGTSENKFLIIMDYQASATSSHMPLATVLKDSNYTNAKLVVRSFTY